ncbi:GNAT family N-acetyltransferase [Gordonia sp. zg691]|uniref:GNAT family N-acetyltransferase n=1 Tax=Gordonia jinghuaiqii TaxID=2758710 RepID=A0A7D7R0D8_9ACTN|nr:GNAT family N-acetyltransferase [Gordonia jinghuaiqii]MBD0861284.1 GNAT family N-acetyltransferase [Gordonia jinghuaiqii]MCR5976191.1 GNAT family N-acetyltransferase [Gordonia jinghuaiqii]QMT03429.1 GNAT family N-acetyltransferase [Gordonia jinghuaiqii]
MTSEPQEHRNPQVRRGTARDIGAATLYRILRLRVEVFVVEQACPYPELDGRDLEPTAIQFWISDGQTDVAAESGEDEDEAVLATLRLLAEPAGAGGAQAFRIGRVCTERAHRGRGLVTRLMTAALAEVGTHPCRIEAQAYLTEMYGKFGFVVDSDEYLEDGIPHVSMLRAGSPL